MRTQSIPSSTKPSERELLRELFANKRWAAIKAVFFITLKAAPVWLVPVITAQIIDLGNQSKPDVTRLIIYVVIGILLFLQNVPAAVFYTNNLVILTRGIGRDLRIKICNQLQALSLHYHSRHSVGKIHSKAIRDIEILEQLPRLAIEQGYSFFFGLLVTSIAIYLRKPEALWFFVVAVPLCAIASSLFRQKMSQSVNDYRKSMEGMSMHLNEMVTMIPMTRAHGLEKHQLQSVETGINRVFERGANFDKLTELFKAVSWVVMGVMQTICLGISMYACFQGHITVGDAVMFNAFFLTLSNSLANLLTFLPQLLQSRESLESVIEVLSSPELEENNCKEAYEAVTGDFNLENVSFKYPGTSEHAIKDLSLRIKAGTSLAITGPSGCGKSTLLSLLLGFVRADKGKILLDDKDMMEMDLRTYRQQVGVVTQEPVLFSGTVHENVAFGNDSMPTERVLNALDQANAREFVEQLPDGINTRIGVDGVKLSGGQMQRIAIARAIIRDPKVLILDEATSALDVESEVLVQRAMDNIMKGRTTFIVAHRMSTLKNADKVAVLDSGRLVDFDAPSELLKRDNFYHRAVKHSAIAG
ncbi:MAG: ABC transporter ATP-binding protein [Lentimonas sp.]